MHIARVVGTTISTIKDEKVRGQKLLLVRQTDQSGKVLGEPYAAVDLVDAGENDLVLVTSGSAARQTYLTKDCPVDSVVMAVLDSLEVDGREVFRK